ncbi:MAG: ABC transporter ATP-binding protein [Anaerovoracaceae bacterium]
MSKNVIKFYNVTKEFLLFKNDRERLKYMLFKRGAFRKKIAIDKMNFSIGRGESVALFGRNGAGKSTILKMITGVLYPTSGKIIVKGRVSALLELTAGFDPEQTGRENIYLRGQIMGIRHKEIKEMEEEIIKFADIGDYIDQPVRTFSSGMKARLGFAVNANLDPDILIVDEALSVGDAVFKEKCINIIEKLIKEKNITLLFVTHSMDVAKEFCERGIVLSDGKIYFDGSVDDAAKEYREIVRRQKLAIAEKKAKENESRLLQQKAKG